MHALVTTTLVAKVLTTVKNEPKISGDTKRTFCRALAQRDLYEWFVQKSNEERLPNFTKCTFSFLLICSDLDLETKGERITRHLRGFSSCSRSYRGERLVRFFGWRRPLGDGGIPFVDVGAAASVRHHDCVGSIRRKRNPRRRSAQWGRSPWVSIIQDGSGGTNSNESGAKVDLNSPETEFFAKVINHHLRNDQTEAHRQNNADGSQAIRDRGA